jgi:hypothetical protein
MKQISINEEYLGDEATEAKHTQWQAELLRGSGNDRGDWGIYEGADRSYRIARIENDDATGEDEELAEMCEANARLIAAAPELLAACEDVLTEIRAYQGESEHENGSPVKAMCDQLKAAITRATGQERGQE